jgi:hypothetical protein
MKNMRERIMLFAEDEHRSWEKSGKETPGKWTFWMVGGHTINGQLADSVNSVDDETIDILVTGAAESIEACTLAIAHVTAFRYVYHPDNAA